MNPEKFEIKVKIIPEKVPSKTQCRKIQIITISNNTASHKKQLIISQGLTTLNCAEQQ